METTERKRLVEGSQKALDKKIEQWKAKGWRLRMTQTDYWVNGKKVYIAELEEETL